MRVAVKKWGNSASVRIPAAVLASAKLALDDIVDIREENGRVIIEPVPVQEYDLEEMVARIKPAHLHGEISFGQPVGREIW